jgi:predicted transcriptional regulator
MLLLAWAGMACWIVCFWWMHRLSARQESMLKELHEMTGRVERLSKAEHALIKQVHPTVSEIKERVEDVQDAVGSKGGAGKK